MANVSFSMFYGAELYPAMGAWIDFTEYTSADDICEQMTEISDDQRARCERKGLDIPEEFGWMDTSDDGGHGQDFIAWARGADLETLCEVLEQLSEVDDADLIIELCGILYPSDMGKIGDAIAYHGNHYIAEYADLAEFAEEQTREGIDIPDYINGYIDWERMGNEMQYDYIVVPLSNKRIAVYHNS